ncbi:hypothetical protein HD806DRAFT_525329 [Xylariaceae sp. AK1471]|nr:hypothetical protein HD806DRAFT_525329 [Xylariaceae sp. AK1471]
MQVQSPVKDLPNRDTVRHSLLDAHLSRDNKAEFEVSSTSSTDLYDCEEVLSTVSNASISTGNDIDVNAHKSRSHYCALEDIILSIVETTVQRCAGSHSISQAGLQDLVAFGLLPGVESQESLLYTGQMISEDERKRLEQHCLPLYSCPSGTTPTTSATHTHAFTPSKRSFKTSQTHARGKGKRQQPSESESDDGEVEPPRKSTRKQMGDTAGPNRRYACPWFKRYPRKHFACVKYSFSKMSHVTQHLLRGHVVTTFYCAVCGATFQTATDRDVHLRARLCEKRDFELDDIPADKWDEIHAKSTGKSRTTTEKWYDVYKILFGNASPLPLPWYTDSYEAAARMFKGLMFDNTNASRILNALETAGEGGRMFATNGPKSELVDALRNVFSRIFSDHLASEQEPPGLLSSNPSLMVPNESLPELSMQPRIWSVPEGASATSFQLDDGAMTMPASTIPQSRESYVDRLSQPQDLPAGFHGLVQHNVDCDQELYNNMQAEDSPTAFLNFLDDSEDSPVS